MNKTIAICSILVWVAIWLTIVVAAPYILGDSNAFLKDFIGDQFLEFMGVVVTITLASCANLFIELTKLEDDVDADIFRQAKTDCRQSAFSLLAALVFTIMIVIVKPLTPSDDMSRAIVNGLAITVLISNVLILIDITQAAFALDKRA